MGTHYGWAALGAGALVVVLTLLERLGALPVDLATVAGAGLLVAAGAAAVGFASAGLDRRRALGGALLSLAPVVVLAGYLAVQS